MSANHPFMVWPDGRTRRRVEEALPFGGGQRPNLRQQRYDLTHTPARQYEAIVVNPKLVRLRPFLPDAIILVGLLGLTFIVRWHTLQPIENGGDPLDNWYFVRQWRYNDDCFSGYLNHHNARFGIHWITWICQKLFGTAPTVYFIPSLLASHACSALVFLLGRIAFSRSVGVLGTLLLLEFNPFIFASSQLRPGVFEAMYVLAAAVFIASYLKRPPRSAGYHHLLIAAGCCSFLAYMAKVPTLFCSVGIVLALALSGNGWRPVLFYCAPMLVGIGLETLWYNLFTQYSHRIAVILNAHGRNSPRAHSFWYLFRRFSSAQDSWRLVYYFFFAAGLSTFTIRSSKAQRALVLLAGSYLFLITFGVRRLDPIGVWVAMRDRYLTTVAPVAIVVNASVLVSFAEAVGQRLLHLGRRIPRLENAFTQRASGPVAAVLLLVCSLLVGWKAWSVESKRSHNAMRETRRVFHLMTDAYERQLPIVAHVTRNSTKRRPWKQVRALHWAAKGFIADKALLDENGHLPTFSYRTSVASLSSKHSYMPVSAGPAGRVRSLQKSQHHCVLMLSNKGQNVRTSTRSNAMPADCPTTPKKDP